MVLNIIIAAAMIVVTTGIHAGGMVLVINSIRSKKRNIKYRFQQTYTYWVSGVVLLMSFVMLVEALLWAIVYISVDAIQGFERALYFSIVTFTTLGYGDIVVDERWRLLASFEAVNGIIMFGWTTAIVVATVQHITMGRKTEHNQEIKSDNG